MLRPILLLILISTFGPLSFAQQIKSGNSSIKGTITTNDGKPAGSVTVKIERSKWITMSDENGRYTLNNVRPGNWTIRVSAVATRTTEKQAIVGAGEILELNFTLKENAEQLEEVVISTRNFNRQNTLVAKMPLENLENPQVYNTVSSEILKQQAITSYDDAFRNVPGITRTWESTGRAGDGAAYFALRGFDAQPVLYNGLPGLVSGNLDPANVEEIQVIKGPSGTLFGGSFYSYGGLINTVTKKPYHEFGGEIGYNFGSYGLNRITADVNTPLSKTEKIALRVNAAYHSENHFQDAGFKRSFFIAPSLVYEVNDRLSFQFIAEILEEERAVPPVFFHSNRFDPLDFKTIDELNLNNKLSFTSNDLTIKNPRYIFQGQMTYKLSNNWTSQTVVSRSTTKSNGYYSYIWDDVAGDNWFSHYFHKENQITSTIDIQQNFNGDIKLAGLRNRLLVGVDYYNRNVIDNGSSWGFARSVTPQGKVDYTDPFTGVELAPVYLTQASVDNMLAPLGVTNSNILNSSYSAYASDVVNLSPSLMAMVSLRADYFDSEGERSDPDDNYDQFALSPKFGLVYQPIRDKISLFANYMNAFINVAPQQVFDDNGDFVRTQSFKPEKANQWEAGIKGSLFSNKLFATVSVYDIKVSDRVYSNRTNYVQGGKVGSKGVEVDVNAHPVPGLNLIAGYSFNEIKVIEGNKTDFYSEPGRSPGGQGPQHLVNLWGTYTIKSGKLKNFGIGAGGNYAGIYKVIDNSQTGDFYLPSYTLLNTSLFYNSGKIRFTLNVNNINNKEYYIGYWSVNPQRKRNFACGLTYKL